MGSFHAAPLIARTAEAYLGLEPDDPALRVRKRAVLVSFLARHLAPDAPWRMSLGPTTWTRERLDGLAQRARAWLDDPASFPTSAADRMPPPRPQRLRATAPPDPDLVTAGRSATGLRMC